MKRLLTVVLCALVLLAFVGCKAQVETSPRYTVHQLTENKIIIIDQQTGAVAKYEFETNRFSPDSLIFLDIEWPGE